MNSAAIAKPIDAHLGRDRERQRGEDAGHEQRRQPGHEDVHRDREPEVRRRARTRPRTAAIAVPTTASIRRPRPGSRSMSRAASGMPRRIATICAGSAHAATMPRCEVAEVEDLLVVQRRQRDETEERRREERQRVPDAPQRADLPQDADRLGERRRDLVGVDHGFGGSRPRPRSQWPRPGSLSRRPRTTNTNGRDREHEERDPPAEAVRRARPPIAGPSSAPSRETDRVEAEHVGADFGRVVVGEQRVVRRRDRPPGPMPAPERAITSMSTV